MLCLGYTHFRTEYSYRPTGKRRPVMVDLPWRDFGGSNLTWDEVTEVLAERLKVDPSVVEACIPETGSTSV